VFDDDREVFRARPLLHLAQHLLGAAPDDGERAPDLVRHLSRQDTDGDQFFRAYELVLEIARRRQRARVAELTLERHRPPLLAQESDAHGRDHQRGGHRRQNDARQNP
jgi:hypothetical protein